MKENKVFVGFSEGKMGGFKPTFKVERGEVKPHYDVRIDPFAPKRTLAGPCSESRCGWIDLDVTQHERSPAWCDRVLWRSHPGFEVKQTSLGSSEAIITR